MVARLICRMWGWLNLHKINNIFESFHDGTNIGTTWIRMDAKRGGDAYGLERTVISKIVQNISTDILHSQAQYSKKKSVEDIAPFNNLETITA